MIMDDVQFPLMKPHEFVVNHHQENAQLLQTQSQRYLTWMHPYTFKTKIQLK